MRFIFSRAGVWQIVRTLDILIINLIINISYKCFLTFGGLLFYSVDNVLGYTNVIVFMNPNLFICFVIA